MTIQYIYSVYMSIQYNCPAKYLELFSLLLQLIGERFGFQSNKMNAVENVLSDIVKKVKAFTCLYMTNLCDKKPS